MIYIFLKLLLLSALLHLDNNKQTKLYFKFNIYVKSAIALHIF